MNYIRNKEVIALGKSLYTCFESENKGYKQDIATINRWAEVISIKGWFTWIGFEDMPKSYS